MTVWILLQWLSVSKELNLTIKYQVKHSRKQYTCENTSFNLIVDTFRRCISSPFKVYANEKRIFHKKCFFIWWAFFHKMKRDGEKHRFKNPEDVATCFTKLWRPLCFSALAFSRLAVSSSFFCFSISCSDLVLTVSRVPQDITWRFVKEYLKKQTIEFVLWHKAHL